MANPKCDICGIDRNTKEILGFPTAWCPHCNKCVCKMCNENAFNVCPFCGKKDQINSVNKKEN